MKVLRFCRHAGLIILVCNLLSWPLTSYADDEPATGDQTGTSEPGLDEDIDLTDEFAFLQEDDIVLTVSKHKQKIGFSPSAVIVITRQDIEDSGAVTLSELLRRYAAVHVYDFDPLYPNIEIRGRKVILLMVNGRDLNLDLFESPFFTLLPFGLEAVERIEIVLGPNSALYGANAVAAVVNVITRQPTPGFSTDLALMTGQHGTSRLQGLIQGGLDPFSAQATVGLDLADSWARRDTDAKDVMHSNLILRLDIPDGNITLDGGLVKGSGRMFGVLGYLNFNDFTIYHTQLAVEWKKFKALAYWYALRTAIDIEIDLAHPSTGIKLGNLPIFDLSVDTFHTQGQYDLELFENNLLIAGLDFRFNNFRCDSFLDSNINDFRFGAFLHDEHTFFERLLLTASLRIDWNHTTDLAFSPRAAIVYNPGGEHFLRLSGGTAFRRPSALETSIKFKVEAEPAFPEITTLFERGISNPDLSNESLTAIELGYRGSLLDKALRLGADVYFGLNRDKISFVSNVNYTSMGQIDLDNSSIGYDNVGENTNIIGVNASIEGNPIDELTLYIRGEFRHLWFTDSGDRYAWMPRLIGIVGGIYRLPFDLTIQLSATHVSSRSIWLRNPESSLGENLAVHLASRTYLMANLIYRFKLGDSRVDLGLAFFNPFGEKFREGQGTTLPDGSNYGGELLGSRVMFNARYLY
jgi:outer membrane receptor protein involved in Fe transport